MVNDSNWYISITGQYLYDDEKQGDDDEKLKSVTTSIDVDDSNVQSAYCMLSNWRHTSTDII